MPPVKGGMPSWSGGVQGLDGGAQGGQRVAVDGDADGRGAEPVGLAVAGGEGGAERTPTKE